MWNTGVSRIHILLKSVDQEDPNTGFTLQNENKEGQQERGIAFPLLSAAPPWGWDRVGEEPGPVCWWERQSTTCRPRGATPRGGGSHAPERGRAKPWVGGAKPRVGGSQAPGWGEPRPWWGEPRPRWGDPRGKWTSSFNGLYPPLPLPKVLRYALCFLIEQHSFSLNFRCEINLKK